MVRPIVRPAVFASFNLPRVFEVLLVVGILALSLSLVHDFVTGSGTAAASQVSDAPFVSDNTGGWDDDIATGDASLPTRVH